MPAPASERTVYHITDGPTLMAATDAHAAVSRHPAEWSFEPWPSDAASVEIPERWKDLLVPKRRALAIQLGAPRTVSANEADERIVAEMARRKNAAETA